MNALVLDGSRGTECRDALAALQQALADAGHLAEVIPLRERTIAPCRGCFGCWIKTPGECVIDDDGRAVARSIARCDVLVYLTPVTFGGVSSELKKALDRMIPNLSPFFARVCGETHHQRRYRKTPRWIGLGVLSQPDCEAERVFKTLVERNALNLQSERVAAAVVTPASDLAATTAALVKAVAE
ncbi:MAG: flavodoxin family protein [Candidatus Bipolaricaulis sp.]|nr:flavodoxin family protein [Candidatus Bipolaricaulis sp.]MDD5645961.1 flavodoxin family protein [Candidatus Bipolaricaulis sp.]